MLQETFVQAEAKRSSNKVKDIHPRLVKLGKLITQARENGTDIVRSCATFLALEQSDQKYIEGLGVLSTFNKCLEGLPRSGPLQQSDLSLPLKIPLTRWRNPAPSQYAYQLFRILCTKTGACQGGKHETMLRLNGSQLEEQPLWFEMFLVPCSIPQLLARESFYT